MFAKVFHIYNLVRFSQHYQVGQIGIIIPVLQLGTLRVREATWCH